MTLVPLILCGGSGLRLWPVSRRTMPKQFIPIIGDETLFQMTIRRLADPTRFARAVVLTNEEFRFVVAEQLREIDIEADIVLEPESRDSAAAVAVGALMVARHGADAIAVTVASDHLVPEAADFVNAVLAAGAAAAEGHIMTLGVTPTEPATGYGYIRPGRSLGGAAHKVDAFVEKPNAETAERYIAEGYLWNSGNFMFRADVMAAELQHFAPAVADAAAQAVAGAEHDLTFMRLDKSAFSAAPKISIDYAVMEKTEKAGVLPVSFGWCDLGSWDAVWANSPQDQAGNVTMGRVVLRDTTNSLVRSDGRLTAVIGLSDVVVVATEDAVLVAEKGRVGEVKQLVDAMKAAKHPEASEHLRVHRPWGWYQRIDDGNRFHVKRIMVRPGGKLSLQKHFHRAEHWVVVKGTAEVTIDGTVSYLEENQGCYLPLGCIHRLANPGRIPLELIEVQVGSYTGEDDIVRYEDVYGRVSEASKGA